MYIIMLLVGLGLIVLGADWLVNGASSIARRAGISEFIIGLTIVGFGTSCPELVVSITGAIEGNADISVGNVVGSNIFNVLFILGLTAVICPIGFTDKNRKTDIPIMLAVTAIFLLFCLALSYRSDTGISRTEGIVMLLIFAGYMYYCFRSKSKDAKDSEESTPQPLWKSILMTAAGLAGLIFGGDMFVDNAVILASRIGVSDKFIAVTVLAGGTSLPELATSITAALKGRQQLAIGNIIGSNIFNILFILGSSALITPLSLNSMTITDTVMLSASAILLLIWAYTGKKNRIDRWEGAVILLCFALYYALLFKEL